MLRIRIKRQADEGERARKRPAEIEISTAALSNDDLLDLADIFLETPQVPLAEIAFAEMAKREISLEAGLPEPAITVLAIYFSLIRNTVARSFLA